ncbi:hypothetical protein MWU76_12610 [Gelidibacter sp. F2691]|nr:hypothetical protein [Gelidibacter sp. F2691]
MKFSKSIKKNIVMVVSYLFILLFVYAAVSKLLDFETFQAQLDQFSVLNTFAVWVPWTLIILEMITAVLLCFEITRLSGLYISFILMTMFTLYIVFISNFAPYVPCSCGGVLGSLGWKEHLIFNVFFIGIALIGILNQEKQKHDFN